jgi:RHS repeat-associated protein
VASTSGDVQERYAYHGYGVPTFLTPTFGSRSSSSFAWEVLFAGYRWDSESGLAHVRNRWFAPHFGTWVIRDQLPGLTEDDNRYRYCEGNPTNLIDPAGLQAVDCNYYRSACDRTSYWNICQKFYNCIAADFVCRHTGNGAWRNCVRACLQQRGRRCEFRFTNIPGIGTLTGCTVILGWEALYHLFCYAECAWDTNSY